RVGDDVVESLEACAFDGKTRILERVRRGEERIRVIVQEHVHLGDGQRDAVQFLPVELWGLALLLRVPLLKQEPRLNQQPGGAAAGELFSSRTSSVVDGHTLDSL